MKNNYWFVVAANILLLASCGGNGRGYVIDGIVPKEIPDGEKVYMTDYNSGLIVDSAAVAGGKFKFKGVADSAMARRLDLEDYHVNLILENGHISVDMAEIYGAKGLKMTDELNDFLRLNIELYDQARQKIADIDASLPEEQQEEIAMRIINEMPQQLDEYTKSYLAAHPNDALGAMVLFIWMQNNTSLSPERWAEFAGMVGENVLNFDPVKKMADYYAKLFGTSVGQPFTDFTIEKGNPDGSPASLSDYVGKGKYVLVDFWASWCMPCRAAAPVIAGIYKRYKGADFEVVGVAVWDERAATLRAIKDEGLVWPHIVDAQTIPTELYGIQGIPALILFAPDGKILARNLSARELDKQIGALMGKE